MRARRARPKRSERKGTTAAAARGAAPTDVLQQPSSRRQQRLLHRRQGLSGVCHSHHHPYAPLVAAVAQRGGDERQSSLGARVGHHPVCDADRRGVHPPLQLGREARPAPVAKGQRAQRSRAQRRAGEHQLAGGGLLLLARDASVAGAARVGGEELGVVAGDAPMHAQDGCSSHRWGKGGGG